MSRRALFNQFAEEMTYYDVSSATQTFNMETGAYEMAPTYYGLQAERIAYAAAERLLGQEVPVPRNTATFVVYDMDVSPAQEDYFIYRETTYFVVKWHDVLVPWAKGKQARVIFGDTKGSQ